MEVKRYLSQINTYNRKIQNKLSEIYQLKLMVYGISTSGSDGDRVKSSSDQDKLGASVAKIIDLERETDALVDKYIDARNTIIKQVDSISDIDSTLYHILAQRYISNKTFEDIADDLGYSVRQTLRLHVVALELFKKQYGDSF